MERGGGGGGEARGAANRGVTGGENASGRSAVDTPSFDETLDNRLFWDE